VKINKENMIINLFISIVIMLINKIASGQIALSIFSIRRSNYLGISEKNEGRRSSFEVI